MFVNWILRLACRYGEWVNIIPVFFGRLAAQKMSPTIKSHIEMIIVVLLKMLFASLYGYRIIRRD